MTDQTIQTKLEKMSPTLHLQMFLPSAAAAAATGQVPGAGAPDEPAWTGFAMEQIMKTLSFVNSSLVQAPPEEKEKLAHKLDDTLYCAKVRLVKIQRNPEAC